MTGMTYDTGALLSAERQDRRMWRIHEGLLRRGLRPTVPSVVLAQAWRGRPQPALSRLLAGCGIEPLDNARARLAGVACARSATSDVVDAAVVVGALVRGDSCVTSDPGDLSRIAGALGSHLELLAL